MGIEQEVAKSAKGGRPGLCLGLCPGLSTFPPLRRLDRDKDRDKDLGRRLPLVFVAALFPVYARSPLSLVI